MTIVLKQNNKDIRDAINAAGIGLCLCTEFANAVWLIYSGVTTDVHGLGYSDEVDGNRSVDEVIKCFQAENKDIVYCKDVKEFIETIKQQAK